jgi:hypothetical protein
MAPFGKFTVLYPPSEMLVVVPDVKLKLFADPDLSFQTDRLEPEEKVMLEAELSAPSNQIVHPVIFVGTKGAPKNTSDILLRAAVLGFMLTTP